jgi:ribosomal-protein-alanine N-acetyltransferase
MEFPVLETERLNLVQIGMEYSRRIYEIFSLDEVTRYYGIDSFQSFESAVKMIESFGRNFADGKAIRWGMVLKKTGDLIGTVGLNNIQLWNKRAEIGFETHPDYWRMGYTSEAIREVIKYGFEKLDLYRIGAVTFPENKASNQLLEKLGFQREGLLRGYIYQKSRGKSTDAFMYSYLRDGRTIE